MKLKNLKFIALSSLGLLSFLSLSSVPLFLNQSFTLNFYNKSIQDDSSSSSNISNITLEKFYPSTSTSTSVTYESNLTFITTNSSDINDTYPFTLIINLDITNILSLSLTNSNLTQTSYQSYWVPNENKINQLFTDGINLVLSSFATNQSFSVSNLDIEATYTSNSNKPTISLGDYQINNNYLNDLNNEINNNNNLNNQLKSQDQQINDLNNLKIGLIVVLVALIVVVCALIFVIIRTKRRFKN